MPKKPPLYPHVPKSKQQKAGDGVTNEMLSATNAKIHIIKAIDELEIAGRMLPESGRTGELLDLFPRADDVLTHIKEDLEDISEGRPFRHG